MMPEHFGLLFILGIGIFGGTVGAWFFQKTHIPQVMGYVVIGIVIGCSGLGIVNSQDVENLRPFNIFALGLIGFLVGGELKNSTFKKYASQFIAILLGEGIGAFVLVGVGVTLFMMRIVDSWSISVAAGVVFGAIASATDPASTIDVLWESRSRGVLTSSITAIVALDDALAMLLYGLGTSTAGLLTSGDQNIGHEMLKVVMELGGALVFGALVGLLLNLLIVWMHHRSVALAIGLILLLESISEAFNLDVILAAMMAGFVVINYSPRRGEVLMKSLREFSVPIYVLFFVLVGARLELNAMPGWLWWVVAIYVIGRALGKMTGAYLGAVVANADKSVKNYIGMALIPQGGIAVGLSIMASQSLRSVVISGTMNLGDAVIFAITATTLCAQIIGPPLTKIAVVLAKETGKDVKEEDVINMLNVSNVSEPVNNPVVYSWPLRRAVDAVVNSSYTSLPVVNDDGIICGLLCLSDLKHLLIDPDSWDWMVVSDVMSPSPECALSTDSVESCLAQLHSLNIEAIPVVDSHQAARPKGMVSLARINKTIAEELMRRQSNLA